MRLSRPNCVAPWRTVLPTCGGGAESQQRQMGLGLARRRRGSGGVTLFADAEDVWALQDRRLGKARVGRGGTLRGRRPAKGRWAGAEDGVWA